MSIYANGFHSFDSDQTGSWVQRRDTIPKRIPILTVVVGKSR